MGELFAVFGGILLAALLVVIGGIALTAILIGGALAIVKAVVGFFKEDDKK